MNRELTRDPELLRTSSGLETFVSSPVGQVLHSAAYSAVEAPVDAVLQLGSKTVGSSAEPPKLGLISQPKPAEFGSAAWYAQTAGSGIGMIAPFLVARQGVRLIGRGLLATGEQFACTKAATLTISNSESTKLLRPYAEAAVTGMIAEGMLRPSDMQKGDFWEQRFNNGATGAVTFTTLLGANRLLKGVDANLISKNAPWAVNTFKHDAARHVLAGAGAGLVGAEMHALLSEGRLASGKELYQSAYTFALLGGSFRGGTELLGRAQGTRTVSDVVSADKDLQGVLKNSPQARTLLLDYGDARVAKPGTPQGEAGTLHQAGDLMRALALVEAKGEIAAGKSWDEVKNEKLRENPADKARIESLYEGAKDALPERNWEQLRFAMIRERAFLNDLLNQKSLTDRAPTLQEMVKDWNTRWAKNVDPAQELAAKMSRTFNANDKDEAGKIEYQTQMKLSADKKTAAVMANLKGTSHRLLVDIGSAEGHVPHAISVHTQGKVTAFAVELDPGSFRTMIEARRQSMASGDGSFQAIPIFADGVSLRLPKNSIDAFTSLSNIHELASYPMQFYGQFNNKNAQMALHNWAIALRSRSGPNEVAVAAGKIVVKDFLTPPEQGTVYLVPRKVGTPENPAVKAIENQEIAKEYQGNADGMTPGERWVREFTGEIEWRGKDGPETIKFQGKNLNIEWVTLDGNVRAIKCDAKTAAELLASSRYGMLEKRSQMEGVTQEQFMNFTADGWRGLMNAASPLGSQLRLVRRSQTTKAGSDYVEHRIKFFELRDSKGNPIDLSEPNKDWHTTYTGAFRKMPGVGNGAVRWFGGPTAVPVRPFFGAGLGDSIGSASAVLAGDPQQGLRKQ